MHPFDASRELWSECRSSSMERHVTDKTYGFETLSVHAGAAPDPATGARALPIYQTTAYVFEDADQAAALFNLQTVGFIYSRLTNPTNAALEARLATLEGGRGCTVASSGHAAQVLALFPLMSPGAEIVASSRLYGGSLQQMRNTYPKFGWAAKIVDADDPENFKRAVTPNTKAFFIESLANPGGVISDIEAIARIAEAAGVPLLVDNTLATPWLCKPIDYGATLIVHSTTKFLSGTGTSMGGAVVEFGQVRLGQERQVPEPRRSRARLSRAQFLRELRRHGLHLPQPCRRPARPRPQPGAVQRLAHHAGHRDPGAAHGAPLRQRPEGRGISRQASGGRLGQLRRPGRTTSTTSSPRNTCPRAQARSSPSASRAATTSASRWSTASSCSPTSPISAMPKA